MMITKATRRFMSLLLLATFMSLFISKQALSFPSLPSLTGTTWEGKYEIAKNGSFGSGTVKISITAQSGTLIRGSLSLDDGEVTLMSGVLINGELHATGEDGIIFAQFVYDKLQPTPVWKLTGYWHNVSMHAPDRPHTGWFILKKT